MQNIKWDYSVDLWAIPVTAAAVTKDDWVEVGAIRGVAIGDTDADTGRVIVQIHGGIRGAFLSAVGTDIAEGDFLLYDGALDGGEGGFTNNGASEDAFDAVAGYEAAVTAGQTGSGRVWIGVIPSRPQTV